MITPSDITKIDTLIYLAVEAAAVEVFIRISVSSQLYDVLFLFLFYAIVQANLDLQLLDTPVQLILK